jgi:hypothetical protein
MHSEDYIDALFNKIHSFKKGSKAYHEARANYHHAANSNGIEALINIKDSIKDTDLAKSLDDADKLRKEVASLKDEIKELNTQQALDLDKLQTQVDAMEAEKLTLLDIIGVSPLEYEVGLAQGRLSGKLL